MSRDCPDTRWRDYGGHCRGSGQGFRGGGRYGGRRYGGRGGHGADADPSNEEKKENPWYKKPPDRGEPHAITKEGRKYFWCGKQECSHWNTTHGTADHTVRATVAEKKPPMEEDKCCHL
eukprot:scaffold1453_cov45-Attheya_sp.AAC.5